MEVTEDFGGLKEGAGGAATCGQQAAHTHAPFSLSDTSRLLSSKVRCCSEVSLENGCATGGKLFIID